MDYDLQKLQPVGFINHYTAVETFSIVVASIVGDNIWPFDTHPNRFDSSE